MAKLVELIVASLHYLGTLEIPQAPRSFGRGLLKCSVAGFVGGCGIDATLVFFVTRLPGSFHELNINQVLQRPLFGYPLLGMVGGALLFVADWRLRERPTILRRIRIPALTFCLGSLLVLAAHAATTRDGWHPRPNPEWAAIALFAGFSSTAVLILPRIAALAVITRKVLWLSLSCSLLALPAYAVVIMVEGSDGWHANRGILTASCCFVYLMLYFVTLVVMRHDSTLQHEDEP